ncbi:DUF3530 family protein [Agaribacter flavus]|uniref:DUF3530 family protein n=1 Tax=Agaribacter flavus TaxID=1902781 RepID=A0ABV7FSR2_9ALTE
MFGAVRQFTLFCVLIVLTYSFLHLAHAQSNTQNDSVATVEKEADDSQLTPEDTTNVETNNAYELAIYQDIKHQLHADEYKEFTYQNKPHAYLDLPSNLAVRRGTILLIPDTFGGTLNTHYMIDIAAHLRENGWQVVLAFLPQSAFGRDQEISSTDFTSGNSFTEEHAKACATASVSYLTAILDDLSDKSNRTILTAHGLSAYCLLKGNPSNFSSLILLSPHVPNRVLNKQIPELVATSPLPILDLISQWDSIWAMDTQAERKIMATRQIKTHYRQRAIVGISLTSLQSNYLSKEIYGWLSYLGY